MSDGPESTPSTPSNVPSARVDRRFDPLGHLKPLFIEKFRECENQSQAAEAIGVAPETVSRWKTKDPKFRALVEKTRLEAFARHNDALKKTTIQLAISGNPHYLIDRKTGQYIRDAAGNRLVQYREFYPNLNQFLLKNRLPEEFKDKFEHEISGQLIVTIAAEFLSIVRRHVTPTVATSIQKELETLSAKLANT